MLFTVGMTLGIRGPVVGPLKDSKFKKHSGTPLVVLVYIYIYTCTAQWYRKMSTFGVFGTLFWQTGRFWKPPHFRAHFWKGNYVHTFFQVARVCAVFSLASPFPTRAQTYTSRSALMRKHLTEFEALLGLVAFTLCFVKNEWDINDVTDVQLFTCASFPRV